MNSVTLTPLNPSSRYEHSMPQHRTHVPPGLRRSPKRGGLRPGELPAEGMARKLATEARASFEATHKITVPRTNSAVEQAEAALTAAADAHTSAELAASEDPTDANQALLNSARQLHAEAREERNKMLEARTKALERMERDADYTERMSDHALDCENAYRERNGLPRVSEFRPLR